MNSATLVRRSVVVTKCTSLMKVSLAFTVVFQLGFHFPSGVTFLAYDVTVVLYGLVYVCAHDIPLLIATYFFNKVFEV